MPVKASDILSFIGVTATAVTAALLLPYFNEKLDETDENFVSHKYPVRGSRRSSVSASSSTSSNSASPSASRPASVVFLNSINLVTSSSSSSSSTSSSSNANNTNNNTNNNNNLQIGNEKKNSTPSSPLRVTFSETHILPRSSTTADGNENEDEDEDEDDENENNENNENNESENKITNTPVSVTITSDDSSSTTAHGSNKSTAPNPFPAWPSSVQRLQVEEVGFRQGRRFSVSAESLNPNQATGEKIVIPKSNEAKMRIASAISNNLLFRNLESEQKRDILDAMFEREVKVGECIIRQGDEGDNFYVVDSGLFEVLILFPGESEPKKVVEIGPGGSFGELALMYNTPRAATVRAVRYSVVWGVDRVTFRRILMETTYEKRKKYEGFLQSVPLLSSLTGAERSKIADALEPIEFEDGENIIEQGDIGHSFYIIEEGRAVVVKYDEIEEEEEELNDLGPGSYFGEIALLTDKPRQATVRSVGNTKCLVLDKQAFIRLLGPCTELLKRNMETYAKYVRQIAPDDN